MRTFRPITVTLPVELADMVKAKVASGEYASESAVIIDSLHALIEKDAVTERWLREEDERCTRDTKRWLGRSRDDG